MDKIKISGGRRLQGKIAIGGAKNAALPLMAAALLTDETLTLSNLPHLDDITSMAKLLGQHGVALHLNGNAPNGGHTGRVLDMQAKEIASTTAPYDLVRKMRASVLVLGPLVARCGIARVSLPGGCAIGARPMDLHTTALEALGAQIELKDGYLHAKVAGGRLKGAVHKMRFPSVGATENFLMAASLAKGTSVLENAAREPEIVDLADCLNKMGAQIEGAGSSRIEIQGVDRLNGATHPVVTDRIELGTYMLAPAICGGEVELLGGRRNLLEAFCQTLEAAGVEVSETDKGLKVVHKSGRVKAVDVVTEPFPGFPTDLQAQMMALMCTAEGVATLEEKIFENRFMHAPELMRMGAQIDVQGGTAKVKGVERLKGAPVMATDLRASVSLILAGLAAEGETRVSRVYHLDRGYEHVVRKLSAVGAKVERIKEN